MKYIVVIAKGTNRDKFIADMRAENVRFTEIKGLPRHFELEDPFNHEYILRADLSDAPVRTTTTITPNLTSINWGKYRSVRRNLPWNPYAMGDGVEVYDYPNQRTGNGVDIYIVDAPIRTTHIEFEGRATQVYSRYGDTPDYSHGTAVASIAGGATLGLAPGALLWGFGCFGNAGQTTNAIVVETIGLAISHYIDRTPTNRPGIINLSLSSNSSTLGEAAADALDVGIVVVASAGNDYLDLGISDVYPAITPGVICVGGSNASDSSYYYWASSTNYGSRVDLLAPSQSIKCATQRGNENDYYSQWNGTSFGAPHVAGAVAMMLEGHGRLADADDVAAVVAKLKSNATVGKLKPSPHPDGSLPDRLLYVDPTITYESFT